ncbi:MAG TPA: hypothetical protein V6D02_04115 [Candidatus Obscuribacterales bacterium]
MGRGKALRPNEQRDRPLMSGERSPDNPAEVWPAPAAEAATMA